MLDNDTDIPKDWDRSGLPGWTYFSEELFALEKEALFRTHWQLVCHMSEVAEIGQYVTLDIADERALVIRGHDNQIRAFHNLCRHRGSRVVGDERGVCNKALICPYHGWAYNLDGTLRGIAERGSFPPMEPDKWGLKPVEMDIWMGFIFVRFQPGPQPPVADILGRFEDLIKPYQLDRMVPADTGGMYDRLAVNWKSVRDVDNEGYHVRQAHPGLHDLYGSNYRDEPYVDGASLSVGGFNDGPSKLWSVRNYRNILPRKDYLPEDQQQAWVYIGLFPNLVFGFYPDSMIYYQEIPISATETIQRGAGFKYPDEDRETKAARYLASRIDRITAEEDQMLMVWSCEATRSSAYDGIILSDLEYGLKTHHDHLRAIMPVLNDVAEPAEGSIKARNRELLAEVVS